MPASAAARSALARVRWADVGAVTVDLEAKEIFVAVRGGAVNTAEAKGALQAAGFVIGSTTYFGQGRPIKSPGPSATASSSPSRPASVAIRPSAAQNDDASDSSPPWTAKADPPSAPINYKTGTISIPLPGGGRPLFPCGPSNFVVAAGGNKDGPIIQVYDLRSGRPIGAAITEPIGISQPALSPDGRYLAGAAEQSRSVVEVWSFISGEKARDILLEDRRVLRNIGFPGAHRLLTVSSESTMSEDVRFIVWDLQSGARLKQFDIRTGRMESRTLYESVTVSPGGRYAAMINGSDLILYEPATGKIVGRRSFEGRPTCLGMAFSCDGGKLACLCRMSRMRLIIWDMDSGDELVDRSFDEFLSGERYSGQMLEWVPDGCGVVYSGRSLFDSETGGLVWTFPRTNGLARRILGLDRMLVVMAKGRSRSMSLTTAELPAREIAEGFESVRLGGKAIDAALPPITTANLFAARRVGPPNGFVNWSVSPDSAPRLEGPPPGGLAIAKHDEQVESMIFAELDPAKIIVEKSLGSRRSKALEAFDIGTGRHSAPLEIPGNYRLLDASPSGKLALIGFTDRTDAWDRIDVVDLESKQHLVGWRPFAAEEKGDRAAEDPTKGSWAAFIDDTQVMTINKKGKLIVWRIPDCEAQYLFDGFGRAFAVSPTRRYLVGVHDGRFRIYESATGECRGDLESPKTGLFALQAGFRRDGEQLAAVVAAEQEGVSYSPAPPVMTIWDLETGKIAQEFVVPKELAGQYRSRHYNDPGASGGLEYRGDRYLMVDGRYLVSIDSQAVIWKYELKDPWVTKIRCARRGPAGRTWLCARRGRSSETPVFLTSIRTPSAAVIAKTATMTLNNQLLFYPGAPVRLSVKMRSVGLRNAEELARSNLTKVLESRGHPVTKDGLCQFVFSAEKQSTGRKIVITKESLEFPFSRAPFGVRERERKHEETRLVDEQRIACRLFLEGPSGDELWRAVQSADMRTFGRVESFESAQSELEEKMFEEFKQIITTGGEVVKELPTYAFPEMERLLVGYSELSSEGENVIIRPPAAAM